jgi:hypothetical protein
LASAQPADPPPTITKSYWEAVMVRRISHNERLR